MKEVIKPRAKPIKAKKIEIPISISIDIHDCKHVLVCKFFSELMKMGYIFDNGKSAYDSDKNQGHEYIWVNVSTKYTHPNIVNENTFCFADNNTDFHKTVSLRREYNLVQFYCKEIIRVYGGKDFHGCYIR